MRQFYIILFLTLSFWGLSSSDQRPFHSGSQFYAALRSNDIQLIDKQLGGLGESTPQDQAKKGALLMKRSELLKNPSEKLKEFKKGKQLLENCISKNNETEFHFIRLIIQEHAPSGLNYNNDIENDVKILKSSFPTLDGDLQTEILNYSKTSKHLKLGD